MLRVIENLLINLALGTEATHEVSIFTKFHKVWTKIVDLLLIMKFWHCAVFLLRLFKTYP